MSAGSAALAGRAAAEALYVDTFAAYAPNGTTTDVNGYEIPAWTAHGSTPGKVQAQVRQGDTQTRTVVIGGTERPVISGGLHIPIAATLPAFGWEYECTAIGPQSDPALLGRRYRVVDVPAKTNLTARRLDVVEV